MAIFAPLAIGRSALIAHQRALGVTGSNVANVNTPGYTRQRAVLSPVQAGGGVRVSAIEQVIDRLLEARELRAGTSLADATLRRDFADRVQALYPVDGPSIGTALDDFFAAATELSTHPDDVAVRNDFLARAETLASRIRGTAQGLAELQREADARVGESVPPINELLSQVAQLNAVIANARAAGSPAGELSDERRQALAEVARYLDVRIVERADGTTDVFAAASGAALVTAGDAAELAVEPTAAIGLDGAALGALGIRDAAGGVIPLAGSLGGEIGALLDVRDGAIPGEAAALDALATTLRDAVNAVQTDPAGRDLDGLVGSDLFAGTGAIDLTVVLDDPRGIAAARSATPGDNANALALVALRTTAFPGLSGARLADYHGNLLARVGGWARDAADRATVEENLAAALSAQREAVSGVNLEEEFTDLIRFQRGFEAAGQLIAVSNRLLDQLMEIVR